MGLFDVFEGALDALVNLPGAIIEGAAETIVRLPEIPIKAVEGLVNGIEKGADKVMDALDGD